MTKSTALKIQENTNSMTPKVEVRCPLTSSEAYRQGLDMEILLGEVFEVLATKCNNQAAQEVLKEVVSQNRKDISDIMECLKFTLNCEMGVFYQSGGTESPVDISKEDLIYTKLIDRNLENQLEKTGTILNEIQAQTSEELAEHFDAKSNDELLELALNVRNNSYELYGRLAQLYPAGKIREAFNDMAEIIAAGSKRLG